MPELTLGTAKKAVANFLGLGTDLTAISADNLTWIGDIIAAGYADFIVPPDAEGHVWDFLRIGGTITTVAGTATYDLSHLIGGTETFQGIQGHPTFYGGSSPQSWGIEVQTFQKFDDIEELHGVESGRPTSAIIFPKTFAEATGQRWQIKFRPTPDAAYSISYRFIMDPALPSADAKYFMGGAMHRNTILAACLARAELERDGRHGDQYQTFLVALQQSKQRERAIRGAKNVGNLGRHNRRRGEPPQVLDQLPNVTFY